MEIQVDEKKLKEIIKESIREILEENKRLFLVEMAFSRNDYKEKIDSLFPQILENWCLVRYCSIVGGIVTKNHWVNELRGYLVGASRYIVKKNDSIRTRRKVLDEIWDENDYSIPKILNMTVINKMFDESAIDTESEEYKQTITDCINAKQDIFNAILLRDAQSIKEYVEQI